MKKLSALFLALVMFFTIASGAQAQATAQTVSIWVGDEQIQFGDNQKPFIEDSTAFVPIRAVLEQLAFEVDWDGATETVFAVKDELVVALTINEPVIIINQEQYEIPAAAQKIGDTTFAPIRVLAAIASHQIYWDESTFTIVLFEGQGYFWKVEKDGAEVYLLGSIHVGNDNLYPIRSAITNSFASSDYLVVEVNIAEELSEEQIAVLQSYIMYDDGTVLSDHISEETYGKIQQILESIGAPVDVLDPYKPWQVVNELTMVKSQMLGYDAEMGIDLYFLQQALSAGIPVLELESYELQLNMLDSFSPELQESMLREVVDTFYEEESEVTLHELARLWIVGDDEGLTELANDLQENEEYYKAMLLDRNIGMVDKIEQYLNDGENKTYFVIAGYLHMLGEHGIVTLLEEKGYTVTRQ